MLGLTNELLPLADEYVWGVVNFNISQSLLLIRKIMVIIVIPLSIGEWISLCAAILIEMLFILYFGFINKLFSNLITVDKEINFSDKQKNLPACPVGQAYFLHSNTGCVCLSSTNHCLCSSQWAPWTHSQGSSKIQCHLDVQSWGV